MSSGSRPLSSLNLPKSALSALTRAGFETVRDLFSSSAESLAKDIRLPIQLTQQIITASQQKAPGASFAYSQTVSASVSAGINAKFSTGSKALDVLLGGGMARGQVLEISGPPGSPKTELVLSLVSGFLQSSAVEEEGVLLVDCQDMISPARLDTYLQGKGHSPLKYRSRTSHLTVQTLPSLLLFATHYLPHHLSSRSQSSPLLIVMDSISFPLQFTNALKPSERAKILERFKAALTKCCAAYRLTVVTTSQFSTKMQNADGSSGSFSSGGKGVLGPQIGLGYLPSGRLYRVALVPTTSTTGYAKLLTTPSTSTQNSVNGGVEKKQLYELKRNGTVT